MKKVFLITVILTCIVNIGYSQTEFTVLARYWDGPVVTKYWYKGKVSETKGNKYYVHYEDGDIKWCNGSDVVRFYTVTSTGAKIGDKVLARYYDSGYKLKYWYLGTIEKKDSDGKYYVRYDDGDTKWHGDFDTLVLLKTLD